ncbi:mitochondrial metal transporter [Lithohypha guttulata]|uniref:Mitochondrial metal transporter n=1 Tax=Lithohypha guttulata TaxID=1690604 RepID=A0AAN7T399_9EURO|nr:mitochondrial metal transporter [Lithohypha guttulata]KAK5101171.1 mitochondrial metal transporter [Lithohypha guttulata]
MTTSIQARGHAGHSHRHHDNTYLTSTNKNDAGVRITRIGLFVNLAMAVGKGVGGWVFNSQALVADAFHSLTDLVSDFMTLATISWSLKPPTERFPYGYGKIESLGALGVSGILLFGGIGMAMNSLDVLYLQFFIDHTHSAAGHDEHVHGLFGFGHSHSHSTDLPNLNAAWLAAGSIVVKEWLYRATMKIARERKSSVLASNAVHHRIDSLTSIVALLTIGGAHVIADASWLDPVGGLIISGMVIRAGWQNTVTSLLELGDVTVDKDIKQAVNRSTQKALTGNDAEGLHGVAKGDQVEIKDVQGIKSGQNYLIDIDLAVPSSFTIADTMPIEQAVRERAGAKVRGVRKVRVKFTTIEAGQDFTSEFIPGDVSPRSSPEPEDEHEHRHAHDHDHHAHTNGHQHPQAAKKNI